MSSSERMLKLKQMLEKSPDDTFLLYAMGMEQKKSGDAPAAIQSFDQVIQRDWGYCYAYHQKGLVLESTGDIDGARVVTAKHGFLALIREYLKFVHDSLRGSKCF